MNPRVLLVRDGLDGAAPWMTQVLREAGMNVRTISGTELADAAPSDVLLLHLRDRDAVAACWTLHRLGHRSVIAVSGAASSKECIRLLNAGADYYLDGWLPAAELVARVRVVLRFTAWLDERPAIASTAQFSRSRSWVGVTFEPLRIKTTRFPRRSSLRRRAAASGAAPAGSARLRVVSIISLTAARISASGTSMKSSSFSQRMRCGNSKAVRVARPSAMVAIRSVTRRRSFQDR